MLLRQVLELKIRTKAEVAEVLETFRGNGVSEGKEVFERARVAWLVDWMEVEHILAVQQRDDLFVPENTISGLQDHSKIQRLTSADSPSPE